MMKRLMDIVRNRLEGSVACCGLPNQIEENAQDCKCHRDQEDHPSKPTQN